MIKSLSHLLTLLRDELRRPNMGPEYVKALQDAEEAINNLKRFW